MTPQTDSALKWDQIDTVLVDMDGTLLDLAFDNFFWQELVPSEFARASGLSEADARQRLMARYRSCEGSLQWYCIDYWSRELGVDIRALKWAHRHRVGFLPEAPGFLAAVRASGRRLVLVTNAHQQAIAVKVSQTGLDALVDRVICSHDFDAPKEQRRFWLKLRDSEAHDPERTLLLEDSLPVLDAARAYGLAHLFAIRRPDSRRPARQISGFRSIDGVAELLPLTA